MDFTETERDVLELARSRARIGIGIVARNDDEQMACASLTERGYLAQHKDGYVVGEELSKQMATDAAIQAEMVKIAQARS